MNRISNLLTAMTLVCASFLSPGVHAEEPVRGLTVGNASVITGFGYDDGLDSSSIAGSQSTNEEPYPPPLPEPPPTWPKYLMGHYVGWVYHMSRGYYVYDGTFTFVVLKNHTYQGKVVVNDQTFYFQGNTPIDGHIQTTLVRNGTKLALDLSIILYKNNTVSCTGTVSTTGWMANLAGWR